MRKESNSGTEIRMGSTLGCARAVAGVQEVDKAALNCLHRVNAPFQVEQEACSSVLLLLKLTAKLLSNSFQTGKSSFILLCHEDIPH